MKTVDQVLSEWSEEEKEQFKDLIEECLERERKLVEHSKRSEENLSKLTGSLMSLFYHLYHFREKVNMIGDTVSTDYFNNWGKKTPMA